MGNLQAQEYANLAASGEFSLDMVLAAHLGSNHYPPIPESYIPVAKAAIALAARGEWDEVIKFPPGLGIHSTGATSQTVREIVEGMHLHAFVEAAYEQMIGELESEQPVYQVAYPG